MKKRQSVKDTTIVCEKCGTKNTMFRNAGWQKKDGHLKKYWCFKCKEETNHVESKRDMFQI